MIFHLTLLRVCKKRDTANVGGVHLDSVLTWQHPTFYRTSYPRTHLSNVLSLLDYYATEPSYLQALIYPFN